MQPTAVAKKQERPKVNVQFFQSSQEIMTLRQTSCRGCVWPHMTRPPPQAWKFVK